MYKTVEWIDDIKVKLIREYKEYEASQFSNNFQYNKHLSDSEYRELRLCFAKIYKNEPSLNQFEVLINTRSVLEFCEKLSSENQSSYYNEINYVYEEFNKVCNFLEDNNYEFQLTKIDVFIPKVLTIDYIKKALENCDKRILSEDYDAAVADAKTLLESVFKELLTNYKVDYDEYSKLFPLLKKEVFEKLNLKTDASYDKTINKFVSGLHTIIDSVGVVRNSGSNSHLPEVDIPKHHAILAVNSAKTITSFLFQSYVIQK